MKRFFHSMIVVAFFAAATLFTGCDASTLTGADEAPQTQSCEGDGCSNGHNL